MTTVTKTAEQTHALIRLPPWMSARREIALFRFTKHLFRTSGKMYITLESLQTLARDLQMHPHEIDRAIDDLYFLKMISVTGDAMTSVIELIDEPKRIGWTVKD